MKINLKIIFWLLLILFVNQSMAQGYNSDVITYYGLSDASASVAINENMFVVGDDEYNILRVYRRGDSFPIYSFDITYFLNVEEDYPEADIEGATMIDDCIFWITSHGRNKKGKLRQTRYRFFATKISVDGNDVNINPFGVPCQTLVNELIETKTMRKLGLDLVTELDVYKLRELAPKNNGLNIEGLCASADGKTLYIGFRNPRPSNQITSCSEALIVPLKNPMKVIENANDPIFGEPILWDLNGLGIRSMEYSQFHKLYFIIAGPHNNESRFVLYSWSGKKGEHPILVHKIIAEESGFKPEALICFKGEASLYLLSDDGSRVIDVFDSSECMEMFEDGKCLNKHLSDYRRRTFRLMTFER